MSNPEVVIVGAGAAGVGAGLELQAHGVPCLILEAADRVGGRAFTDRTSLPAPWDHGCHWFHSADANPLVAWADRLGATYVRQKWVNHFAAFQQGHWADDAALQEGRAARSAAFGAVYEAARRGADVPISEVLPDDLPGGRRWAGSVRCILQLMASEDPERVSAEGYGDYEDTEVNWPVASGLGDLVERMAAGLPIRLGVPVTRVEEGPQGVRVATPEGTLAARAAIVTVSTNVLASGAIGFGPGPAREVLDLVADVPCGAYEKVAIALKRMPERLAGKVFCQVDGAEGAPTANFQVAATERPMLIAHMGGSVARELAAAGAEAMKAFALERLALAFGSEIRGEVAGMAVTAWQANPLVRGAYSYPRPGAAARRRRMIAADTGPVAFAGEAFSRHAQATAHGAYQSGRDVAARVAKALARSLAPDQRRSAS